VIISFDIEMGTNVCVETICLLENAGRYWKEKLPRKVGWFLFLFLFFGAVD